MKPEYDPFSRLPERAKVMVAFSGGVDSSIAAEICLERGFQVQAVTMRLLDSFSLERAQNGAKKLGIPLEILDLAAEFEKIVMRRTWDEYAAGRTPNPCALCNPVFKFGKLEDFARQCGCAALVTGHYARLQEMPDHSLLLQKGTFTEKDQSYFLFGLSREQLSQACFPLGNWTKDEVRAKAAELGLECATAPESQDACFAPSDGSNMAEMLRCKFGEPALTGKFTDMQGKVLGMHIGIHAYTIGQRKGTGVAMGVPAYVQSIQKEKRRIILTTDPQDLLCHAVRLGHPNILAASLDGMKEFPCQVKIRYRSKAVPARVQIDDAGCLLTFEEPQRAVTPGQAAVFYDDDILLGGAWIDQPL